MSGKIQVKGPFQFLGYEQTIEEGTNNQKLTYKDGKAIWDDDQIQDFDDVLVEGSTGIPMTDNAGNLLSSMEEYTEINIPEDEEEAPGVLVQGRLEVNVINNSGATLNQYSAYSLEDNAYTLGNNTVTLTPTRTGIPTQGQTALFFCQDAIANGATGVGIIKGLITTTVLSSVDQERDLKVLPSGSLSDIILEGEYVVGTVTRSPLLDTPLEIAFDGLSNYKFVTGGTPLQLENNGIRVGTDSTFKINFKGGNNLTIDPLDPTTAEVEGRSYIVENEQVPLTGQDAVTKYNYTGLGVAASVDATDPQTVNIEIPGISAGTGTRIRQNTLLELSTSVDITLNRESFVSGLKFTETVNQPTFTSPEPSVMGYGTNLIYFLKNFQDNITPNFVFSFNVLTGAETTIATLGVNVRPSRPGLQGSDLYYTLPDESGRTKFTKLDTLTGIQTTIELTSIEGESIGSNLYGFRLAQAFLLDGNDVYIGLDFVNGTTLTNSTDLIIKMDITTGVATVVVDNTFGATSVQIHYIAKIGNTLYASGRQIGSTSNVPGLFSIDLDNNGAVAKVISSIDGNEGYIFTSLFFEDNFLYFRVNPTSGTTLDKFFSYDVVNNTLVEIFDFNSTTEAEGFFSTRQAVELNNGVRNIFANNVTASDSGLEIVTMTVGSGSYLNTIIFDTEDTNLDPAKYVYNTTTGILTVAEQIDTDIVVALTVTNSAAVTTEPDYRIGIQVNGIVIPPQFISDVNNGSTTYEITVPFSNIATNTYKLVEFVPDTEKFENITSVIALGATLTLHSVEVIGIVDGVFPFGSADFNNGIFILTHNLGTTNVIARFKNIDVVPPRVRNLEYDVLDSNRIQITSAPFNGQAIVIGI